MPVFAESAAAVTGVSGEQEDAASAQTVTVEGLKAGSTAKIYQIVDGYYKDRKLVKYVLMDPANAPIAAIGDDMRGQTENSNDIITESEITTIANNIQSGKFTADNNGKGTDMTVTGTQATASVEPGLYLVLATDPSGETVYNPAVVAVNITNVNEGVTKTGTVDMTQFFTFKDGDSPKSVYLKSSSSTMDLTITGSDKAVAEAEGDTTGKKDPVNSYGDTVAKGDTVHFQIDGMTIPSFSADYTKPQYIITDTIDYSFASYSNLKVYVGKTDSTRENWTELKPTADDGSANYTVNPNGNAFLIAFSDTYLRSVRGKNADQRAVKVTFDSKLSDPTYNFAENHNRATVQYTSNAGASISNELLASSNGTSLYTISKDTYVYSFAIDTRVDDEHNTEETNEFNKVTQSTENGKTVYTPLEGATFTLYRNEKCTEVAKTADQTDGTAFSDENGHISFTGLDEGTYYMKETAAPAGYTLTDQTYKFVIKATLGKDGILTNYTVTKQYKDAAHTDWVTAGTATYTATATKTDDGAVTNSVITRADDPIEIVNTKLQTLPSTGGVGIVLIIGIAAAFGVAGVVLSRKGKKQ
ncbi:MAG: SpaA isopeptide-forming pilin-related protein [Firmicutes bacterium]|nr:SpaA isopeptide-forming pilin-related protein [Bacillota bacterium]